LPNDANNVAGDYEVGYGKPPKDSQFSKGKSGNPKGRTKGSKNLVSIVRKESRALVQFNGPNGKRAATKLEVALMQMSNKAAQGNLQATREFLALVRQSEAAETQSGLCSVSESDQKTMENLLKRMNQISSTSTSEGNS